MHDLSTVHANNDNIVTSHDKNDKTIYDENSKSSDNCRYIIIFHHHITVLLHVSDNDKWNDPNLIV